MIHDDVLAQAVALHLEHCGAPTFLTIEAQDAYCAALERALQSGVTPVPARARALGMVGEAVGLADPETPPNL